MSEKISQASCDKTWGDLSITDSDQSRFCTACCRTIHDFTAFTDEEIKAVLRQQTATRVCGITNSELQNSLWHQTKSRLQSLPYLLIILIFIGAFVLNGCSSKRKTNKHKNPGYLQLENPD